MKKITLILLCLIMTAMVHAQTEHMKFMGIPLDGTISQFQSKLQAKGIKHDVQGSKNLDKGIRLFNGVFSGEDCNIFVYYNENTKIVYRAKAVIERTGEEAILSLFSDFRSSLMEKYSGNDMNDDNSYELPQFAVDVTNNNQLSLGHVYMYIITTQYKLNAYYLHIDYIDNVNEQAHKKRNMDDL